MRVYAHICVHIFHARVGVILAHAHWNLFTCYDIDNNVGFSLPVDWAVVYHLWALFVLGFPRRDEEAEAK